MSVLLPRQLVGKRWTGAIVDARSRAAALLGARQAVPQISDRLLSMRLKELETFGIVARRVHEGAPVRVEYELTEKAGRSSRRYAPWARGRASGSRRRLGLEPAAAARRAARPAGPCRSTRPSEHRAAAVADNAPKTPQDVQQIVEDRGVRFIRLWFTDILGQLKSVAIKVEELDEAIEGGMGFDGSSIKGFARSRSRT